MSEERLDRIEQILEAIAAQQKLNTEAIGNNALAIKGIHQAIEQLTTNIEGLALQIEQMTQEAEEYRSQSVIDRAEFRTTVQAILHAWMQRVGGSGSQEQP